MSAAILSEHFDFATILQFSPRGKNEPSLKSQEIMGWIKAGRLQKFDRSIKDILEQHQAHLQLFLNPQTTLVPVPRSSLIREGDYWPARAIADILSGLTTCQVLPALIRTHALPKSHLRRSADERPSIQQHLASLAIQYIPATSQITLVDDTLTLGRTTISCALQIKKACPDATIRIFCLMRTLGGNAGDIDKIRKLHIGDLLYYPSMDLLRIEEAEID